MIQVEELRIGSKVAVNDFPMEVVSIFKDEVYLDFEGNEGDVWEEKCKDLNPIRLTEEILLKCGFHKVEPMMIYVKENIIVDPVLKIAMLKCNECTPLIGKSKYLHQLQNIYFILKGKELEVKL